MSKCWTSTCWAPTCTTQEQWKQSNFVESLSNNAVTAADAWYRPQLLNGLLLLHLIGSAVGVSRAIKSSDLLEIDSVPLQHLLCGMWLRGKQ
jgi:hypothetical protein